MRYLSGIPDDICAYTRVGFLVFIGLDAIRSKIKIFRNDTVLDILIIIFLVLIIVYSFNINIFSIWG